MSKLRILLVISLVILGVLLSRVFFWPMTGSEQRYSEVLREGLLQTKDGWVFQFDIVNHEGKDTNYSIKVLLGDRQYKEECLIQASGVYTYIHHIPRYIAGPGQVNVSIYKEGENTPWEQGTYYLK